MGQPEKYSKARAWNANRALLGILGPMLIALAGLPGAGKSTVAEVLASELDAVVLAVDVIESALLRSQIERSFGSGLAAYIVAEDLAREELRRGRTVIIDASNYVQVARDGWTALARQTGSQLLFVDVVCSDFAEHMRRVEERRRGLYGLPEVTWDDVVERFAEVQPWGSEPRILVDTAGVLDGPELAQRVRHAAAG